MSCMGASAVPMNQTNVMRLPGLLKVARPGDLLEFPNVHGDGISHWGVYIGKYTMIHLDEDVNEQEEQDELYLGKFHDVVDLRLYADDTKCKVSNTYFDDYQDFQGHTPSSRRKVVKNVKEKASEEDCFQNKWYGCEAFVAWARFYPGIKEPSPRITDFLSSKDHRFDVLDNVHLDYFDQDMSKNPKGTKSMRKRKRKTPDISVHQKANESVRNKVENHKPMVQNISEGVPDSAEPTVGNGGVTDNNQNLEPLGVKSGIETIKVKDKKAKKKQEKKEKKEKKAARATEKKAAKQKSSNKKSRAAQKTEESLHASTEFNPYMRKEKPTSAKFQPQSSNFSLLDIENGPEMLTDLPASPVRANGAVPHVVDGDTVSQTGKNLTEAEEETRDNHSVPVVITNLEDQLSNKEEGTTDVVAERTSDATRSRKENAVSVSTLSSADTNNVRAIAYGDEVRPESSSSEQDQETGEQVAVVEMDDEQTDTEAEGDDTEAVQQMPSQISRPEPTEHSIRGSSSTQPSLKERQMSIEERQKKLLEASRTKETNEKQPRRPIKTDDAIKSKLEALLNGKLNEVKRYHETDDIPQKTNVSGLIKQLENQKRSRPISMHPENFQSPGISAGPDANADTLASVPAAPPPPPLTCQDTDSSDVPPVPVAPPPPEVPSEEDVPSPPPPPAVPEAPQPPPPPPVGGVRDSIASNSTYLNPVS